MWTRDLAGHFSRFCGGAQNTLHIICPFIRVEALKSILDECKTREIAVITTWNPADIAEGYSDLSIYPWLRQRGAFLYVNSRLHAKVIVRDYTSGILSTANITGKALGLVKNSNIEAAVELAKFTEQDQLWLHQTLCQSVLVQDSYHRELEAFMGSMPAPQKPEASDGFDDRKFGAQAPFLLSNLPQCVSPSSLLSQVLALQGGRPPTDPIELQCVLHDMALFDLKLEDSPDQTAHTLTKAFSAHPFIFALKEFIAERRFFGEVKEWLQSTCTNVPIPRRKDLTVHVQILLEWLATLEPTRFAVTRPNYSQCIERIHNK